MIGWSKHRKQCPKHGIVLRKLKAYEDAEKGWVREQPEYCPACGENLITVSIPYLFQIHIHPVSVSFLVATMAIIGILTVLDTRGCIQENRRFDAAQLVAREEVVSTLPEMWKTIYAGISTCSHSWKASFILLRRTLSELTNEYSVCTLDKLSADQIKLFMYHINSSLKNEAFHLLTTATRDGE